MNSATTDVCSWCGKPLAAQAAPVTSESARSTASAAEAAPNASDMKTASTDTAPLALNDAEGLAVSPVTRKIAPGVPAPGRLRAPAPGVPPPSTRTPSAPPATSGDMTAVPPAAPASAGVNLNVASNAPFAAPSIAPSFGGAMEGESATEGEGANLNVLAPAVSGDLAASSLVSRDAAPLTGAASSSVPGVAPSAMVPAAPFDLSPGTPAAAAATRASRLLNQRPTVDMTGEVEIGTVAARQGAKEETSLLEPQLTKTEAERKALVDAALADDGPTPMALLTRYLGVFALILLATGLLTFVAKRFYIVPMLIAMFVSALLLPIMRVTPWADEGSDDLVWFVLLTLLFGPVVALIIYGVMAAARQDFNPSILGCLIVAALVRVVAELASGSVSVGYLIQATSPFSSLGHIDARLVEMLLINWAGFAALAGWYAASSFHKEDE